ncbi:MAG: cupin domain-containing protein [Gammaproteobacteria bacterium]
MDGGKSTTTKLELAVSSRNANPSEWAPFKWDDPIFGSQTKGEVAPIPFTHTMGSLQLGLWRTGKGVPGCNADGSCQVKYSAPLGDETVIILEGSATVTVQATGKQYRLEAGSIMSHPKNVAVTWDIAPPFLKKFWVMWDCPTPGVIENDLYVGHITDNPKKAVPGDVTTWQPFTWVEPEHGILTRGELFMLRSTGSTGSLKCGLWRGGVGIEGCEKDGSSIIPYTSPLGDEVELLLEGQYHITNKDTGEQLHLKGGDILAIPSGANLLWCSKSPFAKKFWLITNSTP